MEKDSASQLADQMETKLDVKDSKQKQNQKKRQKKQQKQKEKKQLEDQKSGRYLEWAKSQGITHPNISLINFSNTGRGVMLNEDVAPTHPIATIPLSSMITEDYIGDKEGLKKIYRKYNKEQIPKDSRLAIFLLYEKARGDQSPFKELISMQPTEYTSILYWSDADIEQMKGSNLHLMAKKVREQVEEDYKHLFEELLFVKHADIFEKRSPHYTIQQYKWALSSVWSRAFDISVDGKPVRALVPLAEMFNHTFNTHNNHHYDDISKTFQIIAGTTGLDNGVFYSSNNHGSQAFINYGNMPNIKLLHVYGFAVQNNKNDAVDLWAPMSYEDPISPYKKELLEEAGINVDMPFHLTMSDHINQKLLTTLRIQRTSPVEFNKSDNAFKGEMISKENEELVYNALETACKEMLSGYSTNAEEDEKLLTQDLSHVMRSIVILRLGEKKILKHNLEVIQGMRQKLNS